jgi:hypothetical protein
MMRLPRISSRLIMLAIVVLIMAVGSGCKSKKKAMEAAAAAEKAKMEQEATLRKQQEEEARKREADEKAKRDEEARANAAARAPQTRLEQYFNAIANYSNLASANSSISEALTMFASEQTPVLIVISESGGNKDYDRPITIKEYLNYLKDQKKNINKIGNLQFDSSGKITELELIKEK